MSFAAISCTSTSNQLNLGSSPHILTINSPAISGATQTYTIPDVAQNCNIQTGVTPVVSLAAATASQTLTVAQSGSIVFLPQCTVNTTVTLPSATAGFNCRVQLTAVPDGSHTVTFTNGGANLSGVRIGVAAALVPVAATAQTNLILGSTAANAKVGDYVDFSSDGSKIYYRAFSSGTADAFSTS
jgi:hypothetical protein